MENLPDSGKRKEFFTGSVRDSSEGKGRYDLLPVKALQRLARMYELGAIKYSTRNWEKGQNLSRFIDSALRHTFQYLEGLKDQDHLASAVWNLMGLMETKERIDLGILSKELDDISNIPIWQAYKEKSFEIGYDAVKQWNDKNEMLFKVKEFAKQDDKYFKSTLSLHNNYDKSCGIPCLKKEDVKDFKEWIDSKKFRPALANLNYHGAAHQIYYYSNRNKLGSCYSTDFEKGVFEPIFWRYREFEHTDGSFKPTYFKYYKVDGKPVSINNKGQISFKLNPEIVEEFKKTSDEFSKLAEAIGISLTGAEKGKLVSFSNQDLQEESQRLAAIDKEIEERGLDKFAERYQEKWEYDELKGLNFDQLKKHAIWEIIKPILNTIGISNSYAELVGLSPDQLAAHPVWKVILPILQKPVPGAKTSYLHRYLTPQDHENRLKKNVQELDWRPIHETPQSNRELLLKYNVEHLKMFSPNFPVAKYALGYANSLDRSMFSEWAYIGDSFDQNIKKEDAKVKELKTLGLVQEPGKPKLVLPPKKENPDSYYRWRDLSKERPDPNLLNTINHCNKIEVINRDEEVAIIFHWDEYLDKCQWWRYIRS